MSSKLVREQINSSQVPLIFFLNEKAEENLQILEKRLDLKVAKLEELQETFE